MTSNAIAVIEESIRLAKEGLTLADLLARHPQLARRTTQRHLAALVESGDIQACGEGRARRYVSLPKFVEDTPSAKAATRGFPEALTVAADSLDIIEYTEQALSARKPVGYQQDLLDSYKPNITYYLSSSTRRRLHQIGNTSVAGSPAGTYSRAILNRLLIDLSWASSHLEGNTYSRLDTRQLIEQGTAALGKEAIETQMILNHKAAIELLVENIDEAGINRFTLLNVHSALSENLLPNPADEGRVRLHAVDIAQSAFRPLASPQAIDEQLQRLLEKAGAIEDPFEQSFFMMVHLPYLQPFADINKRTSRLMANLPLFRANLCPLTFLDVPQSAYNTAILGVYEMMRVELLRDLYVWAYERSVQEYLVIRQELVEPDPLRLAWGNFIKQTIHTVVMNPSADAQGIITQAIERSSIPDGDRKSVQDLTLEELQRLHEGVLARYRLRPSDFLRWKDS